MPPRPDARPLLATLLPPRCAICERRCARTRALCSACGQALNCGPSWRGRIESVDDAWAAAPYEGVPRRLVSRIKFGSQIALAREAAEAIALSVPLELAGGSLVPVPAAPARRRSRGFDSAELIAEELSRILGLPLRPCLSRAGGGRQVGRSRFDRVSSPPLIEAQREGAPRRALLVDDVITTGATLAAASRSLRRGGSERVAAVALCRARPGRGGALGRRPLGA